VSSLAIDLDAHTFKAQTNSIVLAGLTNPFAVQLGTDNNTACTMVRVEQGTPGTYQLTPLDPERMTCELSSTPVATPQVVPAGTPTSVTIEVPLVQVTANDTPQNIQLYRADDNAQPMGAALCTLTQQANGDYGCTVSFNQPNPGLIPLVLEGTTVSGEQVLSPGFALQVAAPVTNANVQQVVSVENAMMQGWQNFVQYGDSAYARNLILISLRQLLAPGVALTGTPLGLSPDQESIYVRSSVGVSVVLPSDAVSEVLAGAPSQQNATATLANRQNGPALRPIASRQVAPKPQGIFRSPNPPRGGRLTCNSPQRDIVWNNKVLVWSPGDLFFAEVPNTYQKFVQILKNSQCPSFMVNDTSYLGTNATVASLNDFVNYGTVIMNTHGSFDHQKGILLTGEQVPVNLEDLHYFQSNPIFSDFGIAVLPQGAFKFVYSNDPDIHALNNTVIWAGFCHSMEDPNTGGFASAFAPPGSNSAYYGFIGKERVQDDAPYGGALFDALLNKYDNTADAYAHLISVTGDVAHEPVPGLYFELWSNQNLGYVGNPKLTTTDQPPPSPGSQNLSAYLEGAASCGTHGALYMNVNWVNRTKGGHLKWLTSLVRGEVDDFYDEASQAPPEGTPGTLVSDLALAEWTPSALLPENSDRIIADFYPDMSNPVAARACLTVSQPNPTPVQYTIATVAAGFNFPTGVAVDSAGNIYVADNGNNLIRKISGQTISTVAGSGVNDNGANANCDTGNPPVPFTGPATSANLRQPFGVAVDSEGTVYLTDTANGCVRELMNTTITTFAGDGTLEGGNSSGDSGPPTEASLGTPYAVAVDSAEHVYIAALANQGGFVREVFNGVITTAAGGGQLSPQNVPAVDALLMRPEGLAVDSAGNLYIADDDTGLVLEVSNGQIFAVAGGGTSFDENIPATTAELSGPVGVVVDSVGNLYIAESLYNRIRKVSNGIITTIAGPPGPNVGACGDTGDSGPATSATLCSPQGLAIDSSGKIYIADALNQRIRVLTPSGPQATDTF
jgi:hypothetical protein